MVLPLRNRLCCLQTPGWLPGAFTTQDVNKTASGNVLPKNIWRWNLCAEDTLIQMEKNDLLAPHSSSVLRLSVLKLQVNPKLLTSLLGASCNKLFGTVLCKVPWGSKLWTAPPRIYPATFAKTLVECLPSIRWARKDFDMDVTCVNAYSYNCKMLENK